MEEKINKIVDVESIRVINKDTGDVIFEINSSGKIDVKTN